MIVLVKILVVFMVLVALVRFKVNVGLSLILGSLLFGLLFGMGLGQIVKTVLQACIDIKTLTLLAMVLLITLLGNVMKHMDSLKNIIKSLEQIFKDKRVAAATIPAFIGLMPMPGGAMLSAPLAGEVMNKMKVSSEVKTIVNYWFRHMWEYIFPLYPGIILGAAIYGITFKEIFITNSVLTIMHCVLGILFIYFMVEEGKTRRKRSHQGKNVKILIKSVWPIAFVVLANIFLGINLIISLILVLTILFFQSGYYKGFRSEVFKESITLNMTVLILSVMIFKAVIEKSGGVNDLPQVFIGLGIPTPLVLFTVPFVVGLLTGYSAAIVGMTFPLLVVFNTPEVSNLSQFMLAYAGALMGLFLSPVHLCLVLSREYYNADFRKVYGLLIPLIFCVSIFAWIMYLTGWPQII